MNHETLNWLALLWLFGAVAYLSIVGREGRGLEPGEDSRTPGMDITPSGDGSPAGPFSPEET